jgi:hypothetical protein
MSLYRYNFPGDFFYATVKKFAFALTSNSQNTITIITIIIISARIKNMGFPHPLTLGCFFIHTKDRLQNYLIFCFQNTQSFKGFWKQFRSSYLVTIPNSMETNHEKIVQMLTHCCFSLSLRYFSIFYVLSLCRRLIYYRKMENH